MPLVAEYFSRSLGSPNITTPWPENSVVHDSKMDVHSFAAEAIVEEVNAKSVLDLGCGTGTFACRLARKGLALVGVDPADDSLVVARAKPGAGSVRWIKGDAFSFTAGLDVDLVAMTGNVAQVFLSDGHWARVLGALYAATRPGGLLVFEARDPQTRSGLAGLGQLLGERPRSTK